MPYWKRCVCKAYFFSMLLVECTNAARHVAHCTYKKDLKFYYLIVSAKKFSWDNGR